MTLGAEKILSRDDEVFLMTGDAPDVSATMTMTIRDIGSTMNASGDLATDQTVFPSNGSVKPVKGISTDNIATQNTHRKGECRLYDDKGRQAK